MSVAAQTLSPAVQNADVSGGAGHFRIRCVSRRLAAAEPRPERRRSSGAGVARAGRFRHLDASAAQLSEEPRLCRQRLAPGPQSRPAPRRAARDGRSGAGAERHAWPQDLAGRLEPRRPLCAPARQDDAGARALGDHARQPVCGQARRRPTPGASTRWRAAAAPTKKTHVSAARWRVRRRCRPRRSSAAPTASAPGRAAWRRPSATSESIEVESSHCGMGHHPAAVYAVADRLAQPEGEWAPFDRSGWRSLVYPDPHTVDCHGRSCFETRGVAALLSMRV